MAQYKKNSNKRNVQRVDLDDERRSRDKQQRRPNGNRNQPQRSQNNYSQARARRNKKQKRKTLAVRVVAIIIVICLIAAGVLAVTGVFKGGSTEETTTSETNVNETSDGETGSDETEGATETDADGNPVTDSLETEKLTLIAAGDVIGHDAILEMCQTESGYDFTSLFSALKSDIQKADIAVVNMESPLGGPEAGEYIGYPAFNTPDEMGDALIDAGFDVVQLASNHSMDPGVVGLEHELSYWASHKAEVLTTGVNGSEEEKNEIPILEKDGIKIAFLNYTYGLNGYELPEENSYMITLLTDDNADFIKSQIEQADEEADFVVVLPHWGTEYQLGSPDSSQQSWAELFTEAGADLIIGTHPHVIESIDWIEAGGNRALCYYSIGNFVSNQQEVNTVLGGMPYVVLQKDDSGVSIVEDETKIIPVVTDNDETTIQTVYLADFTEEMAADHDVKLNTDETFSAATLTSIADEVWGSEWIKDRID